MKSKKKTSMSLIKKSILLKRSFLAFTLAGFASCQMPYVKSGAEKIRIFEAEPKGCLYMGEVSTIQDNDKVAFSGGEVDMNLVTRVELRNKAFDQNANVLVFTSKHKAKLAGAASEKKDEATKASDKAPQPTQDKTGVSGSEKPSESVFLGTTFRCPPLIFNQ